MSVWVSSFIAHHWLEFSVTNVEKIARAINSDTQIKFISCEDGSAEKDFETFGYANFHISGGYFLGMGPHLLRFGCDDRWGRFLIYPDERRKFLTACQTISRICAANELLILPEGTVLEDLFYDRANFERLRQGAQSNWGPPDLDISRLYTEHEVFNLGYNRVHYFLIPAK